MRASAVCEMIHPDDRKWSDSKMGRVVSFLRVLALLYRTKKSLHPEIVVVAEVVYLIAASRPVCGEATALV